MDEKLKAFLEARYHGELSGARLVAELLRLYEQHKDLADEHFLVELCSGDEEKFQQRVWEMSLSDRLRAQGLRLSSAPEGPDFRVEVDGDVMWIEAISPGPGRGADQVPTDRPRIVKAPGQLPIVERPAAGPGVTVTDVPHEKILLRWTSSIAAKLDKLEGYLKKGIVAPTHALVIAVNSGQLGPHGAKGISQYPAAMEAGYPIGPRFLTIDKSGAAGAAGVGYRNEVIKLSGAGVPTTAFIEPRGAKLSGVLAAHYTDRDLLDAPKKLVVVHNIKATVKLRNGVFKDADDYWLEPLSGDDYKIRLN